MRSARPAVFLLGLLAVATAASGQQGTIGGSVADASGSSVAKAQVKLSLEGRGPDRETSTDDNGGFSFSDVVPGAYRLSFAATGFAAKTITGDLKPGEELSLPPTALAVEILSSQVNVTQTQAEIAEAQIKVEEQQRLLGAIPNFFVSYEPDAAPLTAKQKLELTGRTWFDPASFVIGGIIAGVGQAENSHKGFGQGAEGYGKRYGASLADFGTNLLFANFVAPTVFKQDPRYFYRGTGTTRSRFLYAISRTVVCRGDNKQDQFCYSSFISRFGTGFVTNYYYPAADRDKSGVILRNAALGFGFDAMGNIFQEFVARKITRKKH